MKEMDWKPDVLKKLKDLQNLPSEEKVAVFDADGTLWHGDIGEGFFQYQIKNKLAPGIKEAKDPWSDYLDLERASPADAYAWLAKINSGLTETELRRQAAEYYANHFPSKIFSLMKGLIEDLMATNWEVWVCSASIRWALEPAVSELKIPPQRLISTEVEVNHQDLLTNVIITPVPYARGKKARLETILKVKPAMVVGNSMGDFEMLSLAKVLPLVVVFEPQLPLVKKSQESLMAEARQKGWPIQIFQQ